MADQYDQLVSSETLPVPDNDPLFAGHDMSRTIKEVTIVTGQAALPRGTVLGKITASGKYAAYSSAAVNGSEVPAGVLGIDTIAATGDIPCYMYVTGEFNEDLLLDINGAALSAAALAVLESLNIYSKKVS